MFSLEYYFDLREYEKDSSISDCIEMFADAEVNIFYDDIIKFIVDNVELVNASIDEFGWQGDLYKQGQLAEYKYISDYIYGHLDEYLSEYFSDSFEGLSEKEIELLVSNVDTTDCLWQLDYQAQEFLDFE